jgi:hypothetical protein
VQTLESVAGLDVPARQTTLPPRPNLRSPQRRADEMTSYAANPSITRSDRRSRPATHLRVRRFAMIATAVVIEAVLILVVVLSTVGVGSTPQGPGQRMPAPAAWSR